MISKLQVDYRCHHVIRIGSYRSGAYCWLVDDDLNIWGHYRRLRHALDELGITRAGQGVHPGYDGKLCDYADENPDVRVFWLRKELAPK